MVGLPEKVRDAFDRLKEQNTGPHFLVVRKINGRYYVYKELRPWDERKKTWKTVSEYLGRITDDGAFVRKKGSKEDELENAKAIIEAHGGKVTLPEKEEGQKIEMVLTPDETDRKILTILSMNARATLPFIAKRVGLSVSAVDNRIRHLEKQYGIKYIAEIDVERLGYLKFIILVKFIEKIPVLGELKQIVREEPRIQLAVSLSGEYDLLIYLLAEADRDVTYLSRDILSSTFLKDYPLKWNIAPFLETYNFVPLRDDFLDTLRTTPIKRKILIEEELTDKKKNILKREFAILKELNSNGKIDFIDIDRKYKFDVGRAQYSYHKLINDGLLTRITINAEGLPIKYIALLFVSFIDFKQFYATRGAFLQNIIKETDTPINQYNLVGDIGIPFGSLLSIPVFDNVSLGGMKKEIERTKGIEVNTAIVTEILVGDFCYRKFDNSHSRQIKTLVEKYGIKPLEKTSYF